jgi:hypothetical protein
MTHVTQALYDALTSEVHQNDGTSLKSVNLEEGLSLDDVKQRVPYALKQLTGSIYGRITQVEGNELDGILSEIRSLYADEERLRTFLRDLNTMTASFTV